MAESKKIPLETLKQSREAVDEMIRSAEITDLERQQAETEEAILDELAQESDVEWDIQVNRAGYGKNMGMTYLFSVDQHSFKGLRDRIRDEYGTGYYRIYIRRNSKLVRNIGWSIEAVTKEVKEERRQNDTQALGTLFSQALERQSYMIERLLEKNNQSTVPYQSVNPMEMVKETIALVSNLQRPQDNTFAVFKMAFDMAKELGGTKEVGKTGMDLLSDFLASPMAEKIAEGMTFAARNAPPIPAQPIPSRPVSKTNETSETVRQRVPPANANGASPNPQQQMAMQIAGQVNYLVSRAAAGSDPNLYADWVYDNVPGEVLGPMLAHPDLIGEFVKMVPAVATHRDWFEALLAGVRQIMVEEQEAAQADVSIGDTQPAILPDENPLGEARDQGNLEADAGLGAEV